MTARGAVIVFTLLVRTVLGSPCPSGYYGDATVACEVCLEKGTTCPYNTSVPQSCPKGYYCPHRLSNQTDPFCDCSLTPFDTTGLESCGHLTDFLSNWDCSTTIGGCETKFSNEYDYHVMWLGDNKLGKCGGRTCEWRDFTVTSTFTALQLPTVRSTAERSEFMGFSILTSSVHAVSKTSLSLNGIWVYINFAKNRLVVEETVEGYLIDSTYRGQLFELGKEYELSVVVQHEKLQVFSNKLMLIEKGFKGHKSGSISIFTNALKARVRDAQVHLHNCQVPCPLGTFSTQVGSSKNTTCVSCETHQHVPAGSYQNCGSSIATSSQFSTCQFGSYCPGGHPFSAISNLCPFPNTTLVEGSDSVDSCVPCPGGYECSSTTNRTPRVCPKGHFCPVGEPEAIKCPVGTYNNQVGVSDIEGCKICTPGEYSCNFEGSTFPLVCPEGYYCEGNYSLLQRNPSLECWCDPFVPGSCGAYQIVPVGTVPFQKSVVGLSDGIQVQYETVYDENIDAAFVWWLDAQHRNMERFDTTYYKFRISVTFPLEAKLKHNFYVLRIVPHMPNNKGIVLSVSGDGLMFYSETYSTAASAVAGTAGVPIGEHGLNEEPFWGKTVNFTITKQGNVLSTLVGNSELNVTINLNPAYQQKGSFHLAILQPGVIVRSFKLQYTRPGTPCDVPGAVPKPCPPGTYQNTTGGFDCKPCPPGYDGCEGYGTVQPMRCSPGFECPGNEMLRSECQKGTKGVDGVSCISCGKGWYSDKLLSNDCLPCPKGTFTAGVRTTTCLPCPPGYYNDGTGQSQCLPCNENTFVDRVGSTSIEECLPCPKGSYSLLGSGHCHLKCLPSMYNYSITSCSSQTNSRSIHYYTTHVLCNQTTPGSQDSNLPCSWIPLEATLGITVLVVACVGLVIQVPSLLFVLLWYSNPVLKYGLWQADLLLAIGSIGWCGSAFTYIGIPTFAKCATRKYVAIVCMLLVAGSLNCKVKLHVLRCTYPSSIPKGIIGWTLLRPLWYTQVVGLTVVGGVILAFPTAVEHTIVPFKLNELYCDTETCVQPIETVCRDHGLVYEMIVLAPTIITLFCGIRRIRKYRSSTWAFSDAALVYYAIMNVAICISIFMIAKRSLNHLYVNYALISCFEAVWVSTSTSLLTIIPKMIVTTQTSLADIEVAMLRIPADSNKLEIWKLNNTDSITDREELESTQMSVRGSTFVASQQAETRKSTRYTSSSIYPDDQ